MTLLQVSFFMIADFLRGFALRLSPWLIYNVYYDVFVLDDSDEEGQDEQMPVQNRWFNL